MSRKRNKFDNGSSVHPMSCQPHDTGYTGDQLSNFFLFPTHNYGPFKVYDWSLVIFVLMRDSYFSQSCCVSINLAPTPPQVHIKQAAIFRVSCLCVNCNEIACFICLLTPKTQTGQCAHFLCSKLNTVVANLPSMASGSWLLMEDG